MELNLESLLPLSFFFFPPGCCCSPRSRYCLWNLPVGWLGPPLPPWAGAGEPGCQAARILGTVLGGTEGSLHDQRQSPGGGGSASARPPLGSACSWLGAFWLPEMTSFL